MLPIPRLLAVVLFVAALVACGVNSPLARERRYVSPDEFRRMVGDAEYVRLLREAEKKLIDEATFSIEREGPIVRFSGSISTEAAALLARVLANDDVKEVWVESDGGDVEAGQQMGRLIRDRDLVVVVTGPCVSSCANYLFTAGKSRVIRPEGFVVWHGSSFQKDGREFDRCGRVRSSLDGLVWLEEEIAERRQDADGVKRRQQADLDFFASIGVDEYITRVGQEPRFVGNFTLTVHGMARLGLTRIEAPADYGGEAFCRSVNARHPTLQLKCIEVSDQMLAYERARRALGEICAPDGTLVIATQSNLASMGIKK